MNVRRPKVGRASDVLSGCGTLLRTVVAVVVLGCARRVWWLAEVAAFNGSVHPAGRDSPAAAGGVRVLASAVGSALRADA